MVKRIIVHNTFGGDGQRVLASRLRTGDRMLGTGERVVSIARTTDAKHYEVTLSKGGYPRAVCVAPHALLVVRARVADGVGSIEEIAYGEGWHDFGTGRENPYTDPTEKAAWMKGYAAAKLKKKLTGNYFKAETRGKRFEQPRARSVSADMARDYKSERGYVAKIVSADTGKLLARSEPYISNGVGLKTWIDKKVLELSRAGTKVKAEVSQVFYDPERV